MYPSEQQPQYGGPPPTGANPPYQTQPGYPSSPTQQAPGNPPPVRLSLGDAIAGGGALIVFLFSFAPFLRFNFGFGGESQMAWQRDFFLNPLTWWVIFAAIGVAVLVLLGFRFPKEQDFFGFRFSHLKIGLSLFAFFVLIGYALADKGGAELGWGAILMLLGSIAASIGSVLDHLNVGPVIWPSARQPVGWGQPGFGGYPQQGPSTGYGAAPQQGYGQPTYGAGQPSYGAPQSGYQTGYDPQATQQVSPTSGPPAPPPTSAPPSTPPTSGPPYGQTSVLPTVDPGTGLQPPQPGQSQPGHSGQ